jgi:hypothetical protein
MVRDCQWAMASQAQPVAPRALQPRDVLRKSEFQQKLQAETRLV